jgi:hypothetical protein
MVFGPFGNLENSMHSCVLGFLGMVLTASPGEAGLRPPLAGEVWMSDYGEARAAARLSGKPIFVVFR